MKFSRLEHSDDGLLQGTTLIVEAKDSAQTSVHFYRTVRVTYQKERNLPLKTILRTIDHFTNADIKLQVALPLPTTCLGFLDVSAPLKPVKKFQGELLQKGNWTISYHVSVYRSWTLKAEVVDAPTRGQISVETA